MSWSCAQCGDTGVLYLPGVDDPDEVAKDWCDFCDAAERRTKKPLGGDR